MKVFNGTPHSINFYTIDQCDSSDQRKLILRPNQKPIYIIEAGTPLNCVKGNLPSPELKYPFPVVGAVSFVDADPIPTGHDIVIVSNLYRAACVELGRDTSKLATVADVVYTAAGNPRPCGCLNLAIG